MTDDKVFEHVHEWIPMGDDMVVCFLCKEWRKED